VRIQSSFRGIFGKAGYQDSGINRRKRAITNANETLTYAQGDCVCNQLNH